MIGSFSTRAASRSTSITGASANVVRRAPSSVLRITLARRLHFLGDALPLQIVGLQKLLQVAPLARKLVVLGLDLDLLEPRQRAEPQVQDRIGLNSR